jgi:GNAT superfamily N-acetyltransferase
MEQLEFRPLLTDDIADVCELLNLANAFDGEQMVMPVDEVADEFAPPWVRFASDTLGAYLDSTLVGVSYTYYLPSDQREERCYVLGTIHPAYRSQGIGHQLMSWAVTHARSLLKSSGTALPKYIRAEALEQSRDAAHLFADLGLSPIRYFDTLVRPLTDIPAVSHIAGASIVPWPVDRSSEIHAVKNASFEHHWGSAPVSDEGWRQEVEGFGVRTDLSFVAVDSSDQIVGLCLASRYEADDELAGRRDGWIDLVGTLDEWRRRGVAGALITTALHRYKEVGLTHAALVVDSDSLTGANRLYASMGFEPFKRKITFQAVVKS